MKALIFKGLIKALSCGVHCIQHCLSIFGVTRKIDIVIYKVDYLGDWLLAEGAINMILRKATEAGDRVIILASRESRPFRKWRGLSCEVFEIDFYRIDVLGCIARAIRLFWFVSIYESDRFLCLRHDSQFARDFVVSNINSRYKYERIGRGGRDDMLTEVDGTRVCRELRSHYNILIRAGYVGSMQEIIPFVSGAVFPKENYVIFCPFGSTPNRDWPINSWVSLAKFFSSNTDRIEIWITPNQYERVALLVSAMNSGFVSSMKIVLKTGDIGAFAASLSKAKLIVSVETFSAHLAAAMDLSLICLIGGGHYGEFAPWGRSNSQRWLTTRLPCFHCNWKCSRSEIECVKFISVESVISEARYLMMK